MSDHSTSPMPDGVPDAPVYPADLALALQSELAALADIETDYATKRQRLETWAGLPKMKDRLLREMESRHRRERQPHVLRLGELYERIVALTMFKGLRTRH